MKIRPYIKGALYSFGRDIQTQNCNVYNINEVLIQTLSIYYFHNWINKLFWKEKTQFEAKKVSASAESKH